MKKFICLFIFSLLSSGLFAKDFIIHDCYSLNNQTIFLTQVKNSGQYSIMIFKNQNEDLCYIMSFHSQTRDYEAYEKAKDCFENIETFIKEHNSEFFRGRISNSNIYSDTSKISIKYSRPFMYNDFQK